jgi:hypothetical protein
MLKFTYTEDRVNLELLENDDLNTWMYARLTLAISASIPITFEPTTASFTIPRDSELIEPLRSLAKLENNLEVDGNLLYSVEIILKGIWVVSDLKEQEGIFVTSLSPRTENLLFRLWTTGIVTENVPVN